MITLPRQLTLALGVLGILAFPVASQVPDGWIVASSFRTTTIPSSADPFPGDGGLWLLHPRAPVAAVPVSGLGPDLTGAGMPAPFDAFGAKCVVRRPSDGALLVGELAPPGHTVDLHLLHLLGTSVASDMTFSCGTAGSPEGAITQIALLAGGEALVSVYGVVAGPLAGAVLGRVDLVTGAVAPVAVAPLPPIWLLDHDVYGLAVDPSGATAYLGVNHWDVGAKIWSVPLPGGGAPAFVADLPGNVHALAIDVDGEVLAACNNIGTFAVDPATGSVTDLGFPAASSHTIAVERVTGNYFTIEHDAFTGASPPSTFASLVEPTGFGPSVTQLAPVPAGGWGVLSGLDVNHDPETFGPASPGANDYTWALAPNPGGLPLLGSSSFSLTLESSPAGAPGVAVVCLAAFDPPLGVLGVLLNVDVTKTVHSQILVGIATEPIPLPIPADPVLVGLELFVQSAHFEPGGLAASSGVHMTIL